MPHKLNRIAVAFAVLSGVAVVSVFVVPPICTQQREQKLVEDGELAVAEIISVRETGNVYNSRPEVRIMLRVQPPEGPAFAAEIKKVLSISELVKYTQGRSFDVLYDPARPDRVMFVEVKDIEKPAL
jgi:hypothetical protein